MLCHYIIRDLSDESFPIWRRYWRLIRDFLTSSRVSKFELSIALGSLLLSVHRFKHKQCPPQISPALLRNLSIQALRLSPAFLGSHLL